MAGLRIGRENGNVGLCSVTGLANGWDRSHDGTLEACGHLQRSGSRHHGETVRLSGKSLASAGGLPGPWAQLP